MMMIWECTEMPLIRKPTLQELEDHFFGSGAFQWGWFSYSHNGFPTRVDEIDGDYNVLSSKVITGDIFVEGIKKYAECCVADRTFDDLIEDMDAVDVDNVIQLIMFGEIRYS